MALLKWWWWWWWWCLIVKHAGNNECLTQVFKKRCPNLVSRRSVTQQSQWRHRRAPSRRCDIDFLPLVYVQNEGAQQANQRLLCSNDVDGFAPCPLLRSWNETSELICDPLSTNNKRCDSTQELVKTRCRLFETCDQAVLLSGGWNWQLSGRREMHHLLSMYRMLRHNGFGKHSVKIFFANGVRAAKGEHNSITWLRRLVLSIKESYSVWLGGIFKRILKRLQKWQRASKEKLKKWIKGFLVICKSPPAKLIEVWRFWITNNIDGFQSALRTVILMLS